MRVVSPVLVSPVLAGSVRVGSVRVASVRVASALVASVLVALSFANTGLAHAETVGLSQAIELALRNNLEVRQSSLRLVEASADRRAALGNMGPKLRVDAQITAWNDRFAVTFGAPPPVIIRDQYTSAVTLSATQPLAGLIG